MSSTFQFQLEKVALLHGIICICFFPSVSWLVVVDEMLLFICSILKSMSVLSALLDEEISEVEGNVDGWLLMRDFIIFQGPFELENKRVDFFILQACKVDMN